jgi:uncharacterized membrane protein
VRHARLRPRLILSALVAAVLIAAMTLFGDLRFTARLLVAWDVGSTLYIVLVWTMMMRSDVETTRQRATPQDEGAVVVLVLSIASAVASLVAIVAELATLRTLDPSARIGHVGLAAYTIVTAWVFIHTNFALHYASEYYPSERQSGGSGLEFPGKAEPDYMDFLYFSFIVGTSSQTADVAISTGRMRRLSLVHCILAFFFNTSILAMMVNIAASLLG